MNGIGEPTVKHAPMQWRFPKWRRRPPARGYWSPLGNAQSTPPFSPGLTMQYVRFAKGIGKAVS